MNHKDIIKKLIIAFICAVVIEVIVFNITSYRVLSSKNEIKFSKDEIEYLKSEDNDSKIILITPKINCKVKTIKVDFKDVEYNTGYTFYYSDDTSVNYIALPEKQYINNNNNSKYIATYLSGNVNKLLIKIDKSIYDNDNLESITINEKIPFNFNFIRVLIVFILFVIIVLYRNLELFKSETYNPRSAKQELVLVLILLMFFCFSAFINRNSTEESQENIEKTNLGVYNADFINALKENQLYLLKDPDGKLKGLNDPYDTSLRDTILERNEDYVWDTAYYNGHSYIYFGILPALIVFLPYNLITGAYLSMSIYVLAIGLIALVLLKILLDKIINRYFKDIPFKMVALSLVILLAGTFILFIVSSGRVYEAMILSGLIFVLIGYINIFDSIECKNNKFKRIMFGSLCLALSVACRPTCLLASIAVIPYFLSLLKKYSKENKIDILKLVLSVGIPYMIIGIALMYYNYIRFDSIFEFGAKYQLTINNMKELKSRIYTIIPGMFTNLFLLPQFGMDFPFFININSTVTFNGFYYIEDMIGGLFILSPICFITFSIFKLNKILKNKELKILINSLLISALIIEVVSTYMAGSIQRYLVDYSWMVIFASIMMFFVYYLNLKSNEAKNIFQKIYLIIAIVTLGFCIFGSIVSEKNGMKKCHSEVFYNLKYSICFWE